MGTEIEITPQMIEAGVSVYEQWEDRWCECLGGSAAPQDAVRELLHILFVAMQSAR